MRLRKIEFDTSFCYSEKTMIAMFKKKNKDLVKSFRKDDVVLFVSRVGNQLRFVCAEQEQYLGDSDTARLVWKCINYRIEPGTWNPEMLKDYANDAGVDLEGNWLKRFADKYAELKG